MLGIGVNVAVRLDDFPPELRETAGDARPGAGALEPTLSACWC